VLHVAEPLDRAQWVDANLATLKRVLRPVAAKVTQRPSWSGPGAMPALARSSTQVATGLQAGALLGYVAQRVLGQYDLPVPNPDIPDPDGTVFYVVPNIVGTERRHGFRPADFRLWIALHETTHRRQFRGIAWLPGHVQGLLDAYLDSIELDEQALKRLLRQARNVTSRVMAGDGIQLLDLLLTPDQRGIVERMQATMTVLEGHGEFVMDALGASLVPGHDRMRRTLHERRESRGADRLLQQLLGLRQKLEQYALGERFVRRLHERGGMETVNRVFAAPEALPSLAEIADPDRYLARVG
jgi:coenzyme F420 biosynthesis associated uncharacterized protein